MRSNSFDALRLLGSILVIIGHSYVLTGASAPQFAGIEIHTLGVKLFFVISGFLITASYIRDSNLLRFAARRAARIMPALIVVVLLTAIGLALVTTADADSYIAGAALYVSRNALLLPYHVLPGVFVNNPYPHAVNGSLWTLPVEALMYALTPLIVLAKPRLATLALAALLLLIPVTGSIFGFGLTGAADVIPYFLLGAFVQLSRLTLPAWTVPASFSVLLVASFITLPEIITAAPLTALVLYVGQSRWLHGLPADISYGMYLIAFPVQQLILSVDSSLSPLFLCLATVAAVAPLALLSWHCIEAPALRLAKQARSKVPDLAKESG